MEKFLGGTLAWALLCGGVFLACSLAASFVDLEWQWAGETPLSRAGLVALFVWIAFVIVKADPQ